MPTVGFEPTISADERSQTDALDRVATGTGNNYALSRRNFSLKLAETCSGIYKT